MPGRERILQTWLLLDKSAAPRASFSTGLLWFPLRVGVSDIFLIFFFLSASQLFIPAVDLVVAASPRLARGLEGLIFLLPSGKANCEGKQGSEVVLDAESPRAACLVAFSPCEPGCRPGLGPSHLHSCEQSLLAPVIPLTLLGVRISPVCRVWHPASCLALAALVELPELSWRAFQKGSLPRNSHAKTWIC